jgi:dolichol kinase
MQIIREFPFALLITGAIAVGLFVSNILYDYKVPHYISRKIGHAAGGFGYMLAVFLFSSGWWPLILSAGFVLLLWAARLFKPDTFRGVGGSGRPTKSMAEVWFPLSAIPLIAIGWIWLGRPIETVVCILFMAWGDCVTGLVRSQLYQKPVKGLWGSLAMLTTCLIISYAFIHPFWIGPAVSIVATVTEYSCGDVGLITILDDNLAIPVASFVALFGLLAITGRL